MVFSIVMAPLALMVAFGFFVVFACLVWSPFAAVITWRIARRQGLDGGRYALMGAASSIFMLLHWPLLVVTLLTTRVPVWTTRLCYIMLYVVWLLGPIMFWGQFIARFDYLMTFGVGAGSGVVDLEPPLPLPAYGGFALLIVAWLASAVMTWRMWGSIPGDGVKEVVSHRYMLPFVLAWACTACTWFYFLMGPK